VTAAAASGGERRRAAASGGGGGQGSGGDSARVRGWRALWVTIKDLVVCEFDSRSGWKKNLFKSMENFFFVSRGE